MKKLVLLRHGEITGFENRYLGVTDAHLSVKGVEQGVRAADSLSLTNFDNIYCSPLERCRETLKLLKQKEYVVYDERLTEVNFGLWEGKTFSEINGQYPEIVKKWAEGDPEFGFPEGDTIKNFRNRISDFAQHLYSSEGQNLLIVTHGGVIRHLICALLNISLENYLYFKIDYCKFVLLELYSEGGVLTGLNRKGIDG